MHINEFWKMFCFKKNKHEIIRVAFQCVFLWLWMKKLYMYNSHFLLFFLLLMNCRSAFFFFCGEERPAVRAANPGMGVADVAKELGRLWEKCQNKPKFEQMAQEDKARYERVSFFFSFLQSLNIIIESVFV